MSRTSLELSPQTAEMFARCVSVLKPPPELTLSQWADTYRMLSAENSATPGRWHTDNAPYQREIMDAIGDAHVRKVVVMSAAQIGKTAMLMNMLGYYMHYYPAPVLVMQPTLEMGQTFSKDFLAPMIRDTPVLRVLVDTKSRYSGNTILKKNFPGGHVTIIGANSPASLASRPIKVLLCDEVDRYPASAGTEGDPEKMKTWVNTELGETWEEPGERLEDTELVNRREVYDAQVPEGVLVLTAGVDVQDDRFEVEVVGWGIGKESWGIRYQKIYGDMLKEQVWHDLDAFLMATFRKKDGTQLSILCTCIDSGGHHTDQVYRFTKELYERRIFAIKGKGGQDVPYLRNPSTNNRVKTPLFIIGVDAGKALIYQRLKHEPPERKGPNYCHFPLNEDAGYDEQYFRGLTSEKAVVRFRKGRSVTVWEIRDASYKRNEPLDLRNYATAALEIANPVLQKTEADTERRQRATGRRRLSGGI